MIKLLIFDFDDTITDNIDLDYLEILYREKFFYGKPNERVYLNR